NRSYAEVPVWWRRRRGPFQGGRFPRIVVDFLSVPDAPEEIDDERNLSQSHHPGSNRDRHVPMETAQAPGLFRGQIPALPAIVPAAVHAQHSLQEHWQENYVHADERWPEMDLAPEVTHLAPSCLREPVIDPGENGEDRSRRDDVMEMRDHVVSVVQ